MLQPKLKVTVEYEKCQPEKCNGETGVCPAVAACPVNLWKQEEPYELPYPVPKFCQECGKCVEVCPFEAIRMLE